MSLTDKNTRQIVRGALVDYDKKLKELEIQKDIIERDLRVCLKTEALKKMKEKILE